MSPLTISMSRQQVIGSLKATGSTDPDVLAAAKDEMLGAVKRLRVVALALLLAGVALTLTVFGAVVGIPSVLAGVWGWWRAEKNARAVEAGFAEHADSLPRTIALIRT